MNTPDLHEAPASLSFTITSPDGFSVIATFRYISDEIAINKILSLSNQLKALGCVVPEPKKSFGGFQKVEKDWVKGKVCPKDGGRLYNATTKTGKKMVKCENNKWNFTTKQAEGCSYMEWVNDRSQENESTPWGTPDDVG